MAAASSFKKKYSDIKGQGGGEEKPGNAAEDEAIERVSRICFRRGGMKYYRLLIPHSRKHHVL